ncbi:subunit 17 of mediator complex-domain-containing protein [Irpex rosettiformis]|uniref:Subunit 17 of mediator complex-domain-containing protein n=1 Tax=Irpex rosettiformis TaxID=378272 RepID=A0ACB8U4H2_9APHY|nr:subunit 17 of mediator complex-domain-containing protein [Irpex rosettiformis]
MEQPSWKKLKLSLERPYKDDNNQPIPTLLDITPEGQHIYEPREDPTTKIGKNLTRIFQEKGHDFFDKYSLGSQSDAEEVDEDKQKEQDDNVQPMTPEELFRMRIEILPQLHIAFGEMTQARDLLALMLSTPGNQPQIPGLYGTQQNTAPTQPSTLKATIVTKPPPIQSVQAFNTQLVIGSKDLALRKAADLLRTAAENVEKSRARSERYWLDALKIRRGNWGLIPAPLPLGSATGRGADKTSKDFLVSFSLEESPVIYRRRAIGRIPTFDTTSSLIEYPLRQHTCLQVSITTIDADGARLTVRNNMTEYDESKLQESLRGAQAEVVQQEIFSVLIREASNLPTASARVSERLISIDAAQGVELAFELVESGSIAPPEDQSAAAICDFIFSALHILLLRAHTYVKNQRLGQTGFYRPNPPAPQPPPLILQPVVDLLQYRAFCDRVHLEVHKVVHALRVAGVSVKCRVNRVGENGQQLVRLLTNTDGLQRIGGETLLRIDNRHSIRFTYSSPSSLTAHLPQATLAVASISQLTQLLWDEVGSCLLQRICEIGEELSEGIHGTWFVDLLTGRTVGRWEGKALYVNISFPELFVFVIGY